MSLFFENVEGSRIGRVNGVLRHFSPPPLPQSTTRRPFSYTESPRINKFNHLTPNGHYMGRTTQLTSRRYILNIYSTNIRTEYFKHAA